MAASSGAAARSRHGARPSLGFGRGHQLWDATNGWRLLSDLSGADLEGWTELVGVALSDDGQVVAGSSQFLAPGLSGLRAFVLRLP